MNRRTRPSSRFRRAWRWLRTRNRWQVATAALATTTVVFAALWGWRVVPQPIELAGLSKTFTPEWITAVATVAALGFAGIAARAAYGQLSSLRQESHVREQDRISQHARSVFFHVELPKFDKENKEIRPGRFVIYNTGTEPITDVSVKWITQNSEDGYMVFGAYLMRVLMPTGPQGTEVKSAAGFLRIIAADVRADTDLDTRDMLWSATGPHTLRMYFRDSAGRGWLKHEDTSMAPFDAVPINEDPPRSKRTTELRNLPAGL